MRVIRDLLLSWCIVSFVAINPGVVLSQVDGSGSELQYLRPSGQRLNVHVFGAVTKPGPIL